LQGLRLNIETALETINTEDQLQYPTTSGIKQIHRHNGFISFGAKSGEDFHHLASIQRSELDSIFPFFQERLEKDAYVSVNGSYRETQSLNSSPRAITKYHSADTLKYLCACYADIDYYDAGLTFNQAYFLFLEAVTAGKIPPASIVVNSGGGMWALWLLHDKKHSDQAHNGAWQDNPLDHVLLYSKIQRSIIQALASIGCDPQGTDPTRHIRIEGSFHTDAEKYVEWWIQGKGDSSYTYTLKGLAEFFGIEAASRAYQVDGGHVKGDKNPQPYHLKGHRAAGQTKVSLVELIFTKRGGFTKGYRNGGLLVCAMAFRTAHMSKHEAMERMMKLARQCIPAIASSEAASIVNNVYRQKKTELSYQTIANKLTVTLSEAEALSRLTTKPFPPAAQFPQPEQRQSRQSKRDIRRATIQRIIAGSGEPGPSSRDMQGLLAAQGIEASYVTVLADYKALNFKSIEQQNRADREETGSRQLQLLA
jgi:hypothetical protein